MKQITVKQDGTLLKYLIEELQMSRNNAKKALSNKIMVNDTFTSKFDYSIKKGDVLTIGLSRNSDLDIIYEDDNFIVINKAAGLLSISTDKVKDRTAYHLVREYLKSIDKHNKIFVLHRLDKDTSGVLVFCKNEKVRNELQEHWNDIVTKRGYYVVVSNLFDKKQDTIVNYIAYNKFNLGYITSDTSKQKCITNYKVIKENNGLSLLDVDIKTGRKNQIRVTLSDIDHPIVGDKNYGGIKANRLYLHAYELAFKYKNKEYDFRTNMPSNFQSILKSRL